MRLGTGMIFDKVLEKITQNTSTSKSYLHWKSSDLKLIQIGGDGGAVSTTIYIYGVKPE